MLSVGRELNINRLAIVCRKCMWEGEGNQLSSGFLNLTPSSIYVFAYRCPACGSFNVNRKGKVLRFPTTQPFDTNETGSREGTGD